MKKLLCLFSCLLLGSCSFGAFIPLNNQELAPGNWYESQHYNGCCGCAAYLYNHYQQGKIHAQFVFSVNCGGRPAKHIFELDTKGNLMVKETLITVTEGDYDLDVLPEELVVLAELDSLYRNRHSEPRITLPNLRQVIGFRKATGEDRPHFHFDKAIQKRPSFLK